MHKFTLTRAIADGATANRDRWQSDVENEIADNGLLATAQSDINYVYGMTEQIERMHQDIRDNEIADILELWRNEAGLLKAIGNDLNENVALPQSSHTEGRLLALGWTLKKLVMSKSLTDKQRYQIQQTIDDLNL